MHIFFYQVHSSFFPKQFRWKDDIFYIGENPVPSPDIWPEGAQDRTCRDRDDDDDITTIPKSIVAVAASESKDSTPVPKKLRLDTDNKE